MASSPFGPIETDRLAGLCLTFELALALPLSGRLSGSTASSSRRAVHDREHLLLAAWFVSTLDDSFQVREAGFLLEALGFVSGSLLRGRGAAILKSQSTCT